MIVEARFNRKEGGNILEEEIVLRLNRGDPAALEALIDCYAPYVCGVAARILPGRPEEWEELAGDVFLAAWDNRKKLRPGQVKGWLSTVARDRELFVRHYYYGQTVARAAEEMELNLSTAKTRLRRGRERLKTFLQEVGYEPMEN